MTTTTETPGPAAAGEAEDRRTPEEIFAEAVALHREGRNDEAEPLYRRYLALRPLAASGWSNYGAVLRATGRLAAAIAAHRKALALDPTWNVRNNLANALHDDGQFDEALELRRTLQAEKPREAPILRDLAASLRAVGQHEEAIAVVERGLAAGVTGVDLHLQRGFARLMIGDWTGGFADFEQRYETNEVQLPDIPVARWTGEDIRGKHLLVTPEQGFGDAIFAARFLPALKRRTGATVTLVAKKPLLRLFSRLEGPDRVVEKARRSDGYDVYIPNMSLPHLVGVEDGVPPPPPRLAIPEDSRTRARALVEPFRDLFRIGVVWTGSLTYRANNRRSTRPESFARLATLPGVQLFSLYKGDAHADFLASGYAGTILDACGADRDFADSAAVADEMDLMITTDTGVVHVAAAMGKPVWNLLAREGFWLYGRGETTPWYPTMRLFRQQRGEGWPEVFARVEAELRRQLDAGGGPIAVARARNARREARAAGQRGGA